MRRDERSEQRARRHIDSPRRGSRDPEKVRRQANRQRTRLLVGLAMSVLLVAVLLLGVFPTRTFLAQRASTQQAEERLDALDERNAGLEQRIEQLNTPAEIERIAREQYGMVRPGEESFAILPPPPPPADLPDVWPFRGVDDVLNGS